MSAVSQLRVHLYDNLQRERLAWKATWKEIIGRLGLTVKIKPYDNLDDFATDLTERPHIVIVDNEWGPELGPYGMRSIARNKAQYPDVLFILQTEELLDVAVFGGIYPYPDLFVAKGGLAAGGSYEQFIRSQISARLRRAYLTVTTACGNPVDSLPIVAAEFQSIIEQIVYQKNEQSSPNEQPLIFQNVILKANNLGRSGAHIYEFTWKRNDGLRTTDLIIKINEKEKIFREIAQYEKYVKFFLPYATRVDVVGVGETSKYAGLGYSFVLEGRDEAMPLSCLSEKGRTSAVIRAIKILCQGLLKPWYQLGQTDKVEKLARYYGQEVERRTNGNNWLLLQDKLINLCNAIDDGGWISAETTNLRIHAGADSIQPPVRTLSHYNTSDIRFTIGHGDLHSKNVMTGRNKASVAVIDFGHTGVNPRYKDFVYLELSMRVDWPAHPDVSDIKLCYESEKTEWQLFESNTPTKTKGMYRVIREIWDNARKAFEDFNEIEYVSCKIVNAWCLVTTDWLSPLARSRILASMLASLKSLEEFGDLEEIKTDNPT